MEINSGQVTVVNSSEWVVVSDLDGTLLNHTTYSYQEALPAINLLREKAIPLILNTSKTYDETCRIRKKLDISDPFIVENGSCMYLPVEIFPEKPKAATRLDEFWRIELGRHFQYIDSVLKNLGSVQSKFTRFSQCSIEQAMELTGLSYIAAKQALKREFSEPIIWLGEKDELALFKQKLKQMNLSTIQGGRFLHVQGRCDKGLALESLLPFYGEGKKTIVLGDSANDADMLSIADISAVIRSPSNIQLHKLITPAIQTSSCAPAGWAEAIQMALS